jgi:hypothetical protein
MSYTAVSLWVSVGLHVWLKHRKPKVIMTKRKTSKLIVKWMVFVVTAGVSVLASMILEPKLKYHLPVEQIIPVVKAVRWLAPAILGATLSSLNRGPVAAIGLSFLSPLCYLVVV